MSALTVSRHHGQAFFSGPAGGSKKFGIEQYIFGAENTSNAIDVLGDSQASGSGRTLVAAAHESCRDARCPLEAIVVFGDPIRRCS